MVGEAKIASLVSVPCYACVWGFLLPLLQELLLQQAQGKLDRYEDLVNTAEREHNFSDASATNQQKPEVVQRLRHEADMLQVFACLIPSSVCHCVQLRAFCVDIFRVFCSLCLLCRSVGLCTIEFMSVRSRQNGENG